ncbi:flagellar basal body rod protein FlgB [Novilysobacter erysipheiresistens]|uniref:Flagellar basal body rod protein FlgB n=1 Tax=Novilysobacter erysipheiresistens TaxID=1749332 RepID=A0ABU7Z0I3_9GAMM
MSSEITIDAVRLALGMQEMQARVASTNIANANRPGAQALRVNFSALQQSLGDIASGSGSGDMASELLDAEAALQSAGPIVSGLPINLDQEVGSMVIAGTRYQALGEALSRQFGLMRLAISGRS